MPADRQNGIAERVWRMGKAAHTASAVIATAPTATKNQALLAIAEQLSGHSEKIRQANAEDLAAGRKNRLTDALLDRLELTPKRIQAMIDGCRKIAELDDPVGQMSTPVEQPSGIRVGKMRVALGVIGMIYESRPNVTVDAAALCLKAGNAVILRGGSEAIASNRAIADCLYRGLAQAGLPAACITVIDTTDRATVGALVKLDEFIDIIIPRGGKRLIEHIRQQATVPVIKHLEGICHVYIDDHAEVDKAVRIAYNAKARRYGICGAMETLLVAASRAATVLPPLAAQYRARGIELRGCERTRALLPDSRPASEQDWRTEYLDAILSIRIVDNIDQAIAHINTYGSQHTDAIVTEYPPHQQRFLREVDSSSVMVNASTQFADGFEYGLGAEIGISTDKLHVRGPVGLEGLTCQKYIVLGDGSIRS